MSLVIDPYRFAAAPSGIEVIGTAQGQVDANTASHTVPLPSGIQSGDLLISCGFCLAVASNTWSAPSGWVQIEDYSATTRVFSFKKVCDGSEGSLATFTTSAARHGVYITYLIRGAHGDVEVATTDAATAGATRSPPLTPTWGSAENLWIIVARNRKSDNSYTAPSPYTDQITQATTTISNNTAKLLAASATDIATASSVTPSAWTFSAGSTLDGERVLSTIAVRPA